MLMEKKRLTQVIENHRQFTAPWATTRGKMWPPVVLWNPELTSLANKNGHAVVFMESLCCGCLRL